MRKKLILLVVALLAVLASSTLSPASADSSTCPRNTHLIDCGTYSFCCPNNAFCFCGP